MILHITKHELKRYYRDGHSRMLIITTALLSVFGVSVLQHFLSFGQLVTALFLYTAFWFFLSFLVNLSGFTSAGSLILLTNLWVLFVFLIPSVVNQAGKELHKIPSRLEMVNHHQAIYNEIEGNLEEEMQNLFRLHPNWLSEDPLTKELSNPTGWNINYLAKQYIAQIKYQPQAKEYEDRVDERNQWFSQLRMLSPAMIFQGFLTDLAGTSTRYYRSFLEQAQEYAHGYRQYAFKGLFNNHAFTTEEIKNLASFEFNPQRIPSLFWMDAMALLGYLILIGIYILVFLRFNSFYRL